MNLVAQYVCIYLISCVNDAPELPVNECPQHCTCYNAPPPVSFNDDDEEFNKFNRGKSSMLININYRELKLIIDFRFQKFVLQQL